MDARRFRWVGLGLLAAAMLVVGLDLTILSVALPTLARVLNASQSELQWFSTAFMLTLATAMLPSGVLGDRIGRRRTIVGALVLFAAGSALCAFAQNPAMLIAARALMGAPAAAIAVIALAVVTVMFEPGERAKAIGVMMGATFLGMPLGPIAGGWLLTHAWWGWVFLINVPIAIAAVGIRMLVPETKPERPRSTDLVGMVAFAAGLAAFTYGFIAVGMDGWTDAAALAWIAGGAVLLAAFAGWEVHTDRVGRIPVVPPGLFRARGFTPGTLVPAIGTMAMTGLLFLLPQYFQAIGGQDAMGSGIRLLAVIGGFAPAAALTAVATRLLGSRVSAVLGYVLVAAGLVLVAQVARDSSETVVLVGSAVLGFGLGLGLSTAATVALSHIGPDDASTASAVFQALQKTGSPLGVAIVGSVFSQAYQHSLVLPAHLPAAAVDATRQSVFAGLAVAARVPGMTATVQQAFIDGFHTTLWACVVAAVLTAVMAAVTLPGRPHAAGVPAASEPAMR